MTRLYLKLILLMGAAFLISALIIMVIFGALHGKYLSPNFAQEFETVTSKLDPLLEGKSAAEAQEIIDQQQLNFRARVVEEGEDVELLGYHPKGADYRVVFEPDQGKFAIFQQQQGGSLVVALLMTAVVFGLTALAITYPLVRRLRRQEETIGKIAAGDLTARVDERGKDALGLLGKRINQMADRIGTLIDGQTHLLHAVSHELRTPVARIGFGIEMIEGATSGGEREKRIAALHDDLSEMDALLDELMVFLRVDSSHVGTENSTLDIAATVNGVIDKTRTLFPGITFENKLPPHVDLNASDKYLPRALENLIRNAARHADSTVRVSCIISQHQVILEIHDDGPGVPVNERERIFDAFTRLDGARTRKQGDGAGLGLAITERIVRMHRGSICVADSPIGGALFSITLPIHSDTKA